MQIRPNLLYRAGSLAHLTAKGKVALSDLGIQSVIDLRSEDEVAKAPDKLPFAIKHVHLPIKDPSRVPRLRAAWAVLVRRNKLAEALSEGYTRVMIDANGPVLGLALRHVAESDGATVVHCTAGKDRTGLLTAIILKLLHVSDADIMSDYLVSNRFSDQIARRIAQDIQLLKRAGLSDRQIRPILQVTPKLLTDSFSHIDYHHGSLTNYLEMKCGVDAPLRHKLREKMLMPLADPSAK